MQKSCSQSGFTLIEVMVAAAVGLLLLTSVVGLIYQVVAMGETMRAQIVFNQEAREMFRIIANGGIGSGGTAVAGLRGRVKGSLGGANLRSNYQLMVANGSNMILSSLLPNTTVKCRGTGDPLAECTGTENLVVNGYLAANPALTAPADPNARWTIVTLELVNPTQAASSAAGSDEIRSIFYTIIGHDKDI